jgi:hypothetical protein
MKKLNPDVPDVPQSVANRAVRIVERHLRTHRVTRARDLPEEAKIRLYRDLRLFFEAGENPPTAGSERQPFSLRAFLSRTWEKIEDFLSAFSADGDRLSGTTLIWAAFGEQARLAVIPVRASSSA